MSHRVTKLAVVLALVVSSAVSACGQKSNDTATTDPAATSATVVTTASTTVDAPLQACPLSTDVVRSTTAAVVGDGPATINENSSRVDDDPHRALCYYELAGGAELDIITSPYSSNLHPGIGVYGTDRIYGGSTPQEVYSSAATAYTDIAQADPSKNGVQLYPDIGAGLVTDNMGEFVLAGPKGFWYSGGYGNITADPKYNDSIVAIAKALASL